MALYEKYVWNSSTNEWDLVVNPDSLFYVAGTGSTAGTWLGSHSRISEYYDGLTIAYKIPIAGASTTTLNINGLGVRTVRRNTGNLTTHLPVNTVVILTYTTIGSTGYWVWADYDSTRSLITQAAIDTGTETTARSINASLLRNNFYLKSETESWVTANTRSNTWVPTWAQVTGKPSWIGSSKPSYDLGEISETATYKRVTEAEKNNWNLKADITDVEAKIGAYKGSANGLAELDQNGKVPAAQLPSFVDDVLEYTDLASFPTTGESGKIYIDLTTNKTYRWGGSGYVVISDTISLGETISTAYRGDRGKIAYDHSQSAHAPSNAQKNSDITKAEIEAKLTGIITSHTHTYNLDQINEGATYKRVTQSEKDGWNSKQNPLGFTPENVANKRTSIRTSGADNTSYVSELGVKTYVDGIAATKQDSLGFTPVPTTRTIAGLNLTSDRTRDQILGVSSNGYYRRTGTNTYDIRTVGDLQSDLGLGSAAYANISAFKSSSWPNGSESQYVRGDGSLATFPTISQNLELLRSRSGTNSLTSNTMNSVKGVGLQLSRGDTIMFEVLHTSGVSTTTPKVVTATVGSAANSNSHERSITYTTWDGAEQRVYSMSVALISNELIFGNTNYMRIYKSGSDMVVSNGSWTPYIGRVWKVVGV